MTNLCSLFNSKSRPKNNLLFRHNWVNSIIWSFFPTTRSSASTRAPVSVDNSLVKLQSHMLGIQLQTAMQLNPSPHCLLLSWQKFPTSFHSRHSNSLRFHCFALCKWMLVWRNLRLQFASGCGFVWCNCFQTSNDKVIRLAWKLRVKKDTINFTCKWQNFAATVLVIIRLQRAEHLN